MKKTNLIVLVFLMAMLVVMLFSTATVFAEEVEETPVVGETQPVVEETQPEEITQEEVEEVDKINEIIDKWFSPDKIAMYLSWIAYIGTILGLVANIKKLHQTNNLTLKNVSDDFKKVLKATVGDEVSKRFDNIAPKIMETQEKTNQIMSIFAKILALSQENTPESRVAILNLIEELGTVGKDITDNAKVIIEETVKAQEEAKEELDNKIDEIVDSYDGTSI